MNYNKTAIQKVREDRLLIDHYDEWLLEEYRSFLGKRILEIGCGMGNISGYFQDCELYIGIDTSLECILALQKKYKNNANMQFILCDITDQTISNFREFNLDTVVSINVFEHIANDELAFHNISQILNPGSKFISIVPAHNILFGEMDRSIGHYRRYTKASMTTKITSSGFSIIKQEYINFLGAIGWFVNGRVFKRKTPPTNQLRFLNFIMPVNKIFEQIFRFPIGISLVTIGEKNLP